LVFTQQRGSAHPFPFAVPPHNNPMPPHAIPRCPMQPHATPSTLLVCCCRSASGRIWHCRQPVRVPARRACRQPHTPAATPAQHATGGRAANAFRKVGCSRTGHFPSLACCGYVPEHLSGMCMCVPHNSPSAMAAPRTHTCAPSMRLICIQYAPSTHPVHTMQFYGGHYTYSIHVCTCTRTRMHLYTWMYLPAIPRHRHMLTPRMLAGRARYQCLIWPRPHQRRVLPGTRDERASDGAACR